MPKLSDAQMDEMVNFSVDEKELADWYELKEQLDTLRAKEMLMRKSIFSRLFPKPVEGTNKVDLADGFVLKATHKIDRKVDEAALANLKEEFFAEKIPIDNLVRWKPDLSVSAYRKLNPVQVNLFDRALIIKEGSPTLEIVKPKK